MLICIFIATLTRTVHNGNKPTIELLRNIDLLQQTWLATSDSSFPPEMQLFDRQIHSSTRLAIPTHLLHFRHPTVRLHKKLMPTSLPTDVHNFVLQCVGIRSSTLFKTLYIDRQRYSADGTDDSRVTHDGCVLYEDNGTAKVGFLEAVIRFENQYELALVIRPVNLSSAADILAIAGRIFKCTNVLYGKLDGSTLELTRVKCLIQKLAFRTDANSNRDSPSNSMFFFQFPNLQAST
jgi:hypothetical protein